MDVSTARPVKRIVLIRMCCWRNEDTNVMEMMNGAIPFDLNETEAAMKPHQWLHHDSNDGSSMLFTIMYVA